MSQGDIKGKLRKKSSRKCPECEEHFLEVRDIDNLSISICPGCGYEKEDKAQNKRNIRKSRDVKNEELEIHQEQTTIRDGNKASDNTRLGKSGRRNEGRASRTNS